VKKVRTRIPRSIVIAAASNSVMLFAFIICLLFSIGDIDKVANTPTGLPLIEVFYEATKSKNATNFLVSMPAIVLFFTVFNVFASVSRLIWTFAKDKGLPFSRQFAYASHPFFFPLSGPAKSQNQVLTWCSGPPYSTAPFECSGSRLYHQLPASDHLHWLIDSVQRNYLAAGNGVVRFVHTADRLPSDTADSWERTTAGALHNGSCRPCHQPPRARISYIRRHLDAISTDAAGNGVEHELRRAAPWCGYLRRAVGLGNQWTQKIPSPGRSKNVKARHSATESTELLTIHVALSSIQWRDSM
jgi:hypothetical protein